MLAAIDNTPQQVAADAVLVVLIIANAIAGWRWGTVRRVLAFAGLYAGIIGAYYIGNGIASFINKGSLYTNAWTFVGVTAAAVIGFEVLGRLFADRLDRLISLAFDRAAGALVGAAVGFFEALLLFLVALSVGAAPTTPTNNVPPSHAAASTAVTSSVLAGRAVRAEPALQRIISPLLTGDLTSHFLEGIGSS